ncbi:MAG: outer membrane lipoprotein carrier protein LolA [Bacteroidales bacterium]|nr:outer membrane lipoprotein carrier protein LolA [Bacteroidales bacterium]
MRISRFIYTALVPAFMAVAFSFTMKGQNADAVISRINAKAATIKTIEADFTQEKDLSILNDKMVSKGKMYYDKGMLRWEYTSPYSYLFIMNGEKVLLQSSTSTTTGDVASNRIYRMIARIMVDTITGKSLDGGGDFAVKMETSSKGNVAVLTPLKREIKSMFKEVRLHFDDSDCVSKIELVEGTGDKTVISLSGVKYNAPVSASLFEVK